jgi:hypothetical protein
VLPGGFATDPYLSGRALPTPTGHEELSQATGQSVARVTQECLAHT